MTDTTLTMQPKDVLSDDEIKRFSERSDTRALAVFGANWGLIAATFAVAAWWMHPVTLILALIVLGGRQLGLAVLMHECGHRTLFRTAWLNDFFGQWLAAYPVFLDMKSYAREHLIHHRLAGTVDDPDLPNYRAYPVSRASFRRKVVRDLTGQTGFQFVRHIIQNLGDPFSRNPRNQGALRNALLVNALMALALILAGHGGLYLLWPAAYLTTYMLFARIRQIAEHAAVPDRLSPDPRNNTRTTYANGLERLLIAPNRVNYHLEHHFMASVPMYRLKTLHEHLKKRGVYRDMHFPRGYGQVLRAVTD